MNRICRPSAAMRDRRPSSRCGSGRWRSSAARRQASMTDSTSCAVLPDQPGERPAGQLQGQRARQERDTAVAWPEAAADRRCRTGCVRRGRRRRASDRDPGRRTGRESAGGAIADRRRGACGRRRTDRPWSGAPGPGTTARRARSATPRTGPTGAAGRGGPGACSPSCPGRRSRGPRTPTGRDTEGWRACSGSPCATSGRRAPAGCGGSWDRR